MFVFFPLGFQTRKKPKAERFTEEEEEEDSFCLMTITCVILFS
jgi:hypothetical protein